MVRGVRHDMLLSWEAHSVIGLPIKELGLGSSPAWGFVAHIAHAVGGWFDGSQSVWRSSILATSCFSRTDVGSAACSPLSQLYWAFSRKE